VAQVRVSSTPGVDLPFRCHAGSAQSGDDLPPGWAPLQIQGIEPVYALAVVVVGGVLQLAVQVPALSDWVCCPISALGLASMRGARRQTCRSQHRQADGACPLGVSVAQISLLINTRSPPTSRRQRELADVRRPVDGVSNRHWRGHRGGLTSPAVGGQALNDSARYSAMLTGVCAWWCCWRCPARRPC
jgi:putative peptidoglycan lipid II flippase